MFKRKKQTFLNFDDDTSDLYSDIDTSTVIQSVKNKEHLNNVDFFMSNRLESKVNNLRYENIHIFISERDVRAFFDGQINKIFISNQLKMVKDLKNKFVKDVFTTTGLTNEDIEDIKDTQKLNQTSIEPMDQTSFSLKELWGKVIIVIFSEIINEISDIFQKGFKKDSQDSFFSTLKTRLTKLKQRIWNKLSDLHLLRINFKDILSQFLSNLGNVILNMFTGTISKIMELIKTAVFSFISAFKIILDISKSLNERLHEASKIILSSVAMGALISIDILFVTGFPEWATLPITTLLGGLVTILISWVLDTLDIFKAKKKEIEEIRYKVFTTLQDKNIQQIEDLNNMISQTTFKYSSK